MADTGWKEVAKSEEIEEGKLFSVDLSEEESVLIVRRADGLVAWDNACTHVGCPLSFGHLRGDVLTCPCHNARFDVSSGKMLTAPGLDDLSRYEVREEEGRVYVGARHEAVFPKSGRGESKTVVIVGAGGGGNAAAEQLRREGYGGRIVMITPEKERPYDRTKLSKFFLTEGMGIDQVALRPPDFYEEAGIELWTERRVSAVDSGTRRITLEDGEMLDADALVLATGSRAKSLPIEGADLEACFTLRSLQDATAIRSAADKAKNVVVIGASFIGTETAAYLRDRGLAVHVVAPERVPFAHLVGERVERVELDDGSSLPADLVIMGVGVEPVVDYLEGSGLVENGAVPVNTRLETKVPGIYAVGDIARVSGGRGNPGEHRVEHWIVAERHGQEAARSITGTGQGLVYAPFFWTRQFETSFGYVGFSPDYDDVRYKGDVEEDKFLVGYFKGGELTAVGSIGKNKSLIRYGYLLDEGKRVTVDDFEAGLKKMGPK